MTRQRTALNVSALFRKSHLALCILSLAGMAAAVPSVATESPRII